MKRRKFLELLGISPLSVPAISLASPPQGSANVDKPKPPPTELNTPEEFPTGTIRMWTYAGIPRGWLECNGDWINCVEYPELYEALKDGHSMWDGKGYITLPYIKTTKAVDIRTTTSMSSEPVFLTAKHIIKT